MKYVLYTNDTVIDNGSSFVVLIPTGALSLGETIAKDVPQGSKFKIVDLDNPSEREEFAKVGLSTNANVSYWTAWEGNFDDVEAPISFTINMEKAKECHLRYLRNFRSLELPKLDIEYQKADEANNVELKALIAAKRQKLRDMPSDTRIVNCSDFETLQTLTYEFLRDN